ncbi:hypothetical protein [Hoeflea sp. TYP-13]|uniref:hypothetical protein n=1 Tax=Hoeflea sp. TYP-13 TaxID=3230023 RepID=UPI0034C5BC84
MKIFIILLPAILIAAPAGAAKMYNIDNMTCGQVQSILKREGAAQLRYTSRNNPSLPIYNRYVSGSTHCSSRSIANLATVPTRDNAKCTVRICRRFGDR